MDNEMRSSIEGSNASGVATEDTEYQTIDLMKYLVILWQQRGIIVGFALTGLVVAIIVSFVLRPKYDATARLQPPTPRQSALMTSFLPTRNEGDIYLGFLTSRSVADDVIEHQKLKEYFHTTKPSALRRNLSAISTIKVDKDQFITVTVRTPEPETSMRITNEYVDALYRLSHSIALAEAEHRWEYFEGPLEQEKNKLAVAEEELKRAQQKTGMVLPEAQVRVGLTALAQLRQEIATREVQLAALRTGSTEENPRVIQLKSQIDNLYGQVARMEAQTGGGMGVKANLPELTLEVERKAREVKFHETLFEILSRQYENARVDQSYTPPVEVVDRAVLPDEKSWPTRKLFAIGGLFAGGLIGVVYGIWRAYELSRKWKGAFQHIRNAPVVRL